MPRRASSGGRTSSPTRNTTTAQAPPKQPTPVQTHPPVQTQQQGGFLSGMAGTFMTGMALGAGSEVAHQTIRGFMGGSSHQQAAPQQEQPVQNYQNQQKPQYCEAENQRFISCLKDNSDIGLCQTYMDIFKDCQKKYGL